MAPEPDRDRPTPRPSVLLVDDDPYFLKLLTRQLTQLGFEEIVTAEDGASALGVLHRHRPMPGLILCDLQMPTMSGVEFLRQLNYEAYTGAIGLISGESAHTLQSVEELVHSYGLRHGFSLAKPVDLDDLSQHLAALEGEPAAPQPEPAAASPPHLDDLRRLVVDRDVGVDIEPVLDAGSGEITAFAAHACSLHGPRTPLLSAALAQDSALSEQMLDIVLRRALTVCEPLLRATPAAMLDVDLPACLLQQEILADRIQTTATRFRFSLQKLRLRIAWADEASVDDRSLSLANDLVLRGIRLWAGPQASSWGMLERLLRLPLAGVCLEPQLARRTTRSRHAKALLRNAVDLLHSLGLPVAVTGVDSEPAFSLCAGIGADQICGEHVAPRMPPDAAYLWHQMYRPVPAPGAR